MAWKKDLAKLKQDLGKEEGLPPGKSAPPPKAKPLHPVSQSIEEEDNIFLSAMGLRPKAGPAEPVAALVKDEPPAFIQPKPAPLAGKVEFSTAMGDLKGLKPLAQPAVQEKPAAPVPVPEAPVPPPPAPPEPAPVDAAPEIKEAPAAPPQVQIQLAAGMAIVVDGSLDLKGHARSDAE
jgi:hypothetical protein